MKITFINVGYGEAILISHNQKNILIDAGSALDTEFDGKSSRIRSIDYLKLKNITKIDTLVLTHLHEDHLCGAKAIVEQLDVGEIITNINYKLIDLTKDIKILDNSAYYVNCFKDTLNTYRDIIKIAEKLNIKVTQLEYKKDMQVNLAGIIQADILGPNIAYKDKFEELLGEIYCCDSREKASQLCNTMDKYSNLTAIALRLHMGEKKVLLPSDLIPEHMKHIENKDIFKADILKIAHHGQIDGFNEEFIKNVGPDMIITCSSSDRRNNSACTDVYSKIAALLPSCKFYFTDEVEYENLFSAKSEFCALSINLEDQYCVDFDVVGGV